MDKIKYRIPGDYPASRLYDVMRLVRELRDAQARGEHELVYRALAVVEKSLESIKDDLCYDCTYSAQDTVPREYTEQLGYK